MKLRSILLVATLFLAACAAPGAMLNDMPPPIDKPENPRAVANQLADLLAGNFVLPDVAAKYAAMLRANAAAGRYDGENNAAQLATHLTSDLQAVNPDRHLRVRARAIPRADGSTDEPPPPPATESAEWIRPGVAYLKFYELSPEARQIDDVHDFMRSHRDARALIIDVRDCHGGTLDVMDEVLPYLFDRRTTLVTLEVRREAADRIGDYLDGNDSTPRTYRDASIIRHVHVVTPARDRGDLDTVPVFYLTSAKTASACEHLALALHRTHRAVLIGETTRGAGHFGGTLPLGNALSVFVPVGRTYDPDTGWDWEGKGITPNIAVPADKALDTALQRTASLSQRQLP